MRFPPQFLDAIRARLPISQVVGRRVSWDKRKSNPGRGDFWACCPFHGEKTPSFHANDRKGRYHCFGCGVSGDHFTFLVEQEGLSFPDAVGQLAAEAGIPMPDRDPGAERREAERASLHEVLDKTARFFEAALHSPEGARARAYLRERGLGSDLQKRFGIGYAPASRNALKEHLAAAGVGHDQMIEAGLLVAGDDIPVAYDRFRDRVIFPITDLRGRVIAFGGRALAADAQAKYLNSPETPLFSKSRVLYNGQAARAASRKGGPVIAVEGYIDVIACVSAGFEATVAPLGTALTEDQLHLLWQMSDEPTLCFDGDDAGLKAAFRAVDTALPHLKPGKSVKFALLPGGQDPDDFLRGEGAEPFRGLLEGAKPLVEMLWVRAAYGVDLATPERRAGLEQELRSAAARIGDSAVRRHYEFAIREQVARHLGSWRKPSTYTQPRNNRGRGCWAAEPTGPSASLLSTAMVKKGGQGKAVSPTLRDAVLVGTLLLHPEIADERLELLADSDLLSPFVAPLANALASILSEHPGMTSVELRTALDAAGQGETVKLVLDRLLGSGLGGLAQESAERAATIWDDAAHLRMRAGALSIARRAAAQALGRDTSELDLVRLRDIQEQDQRSIRPDERDSAEAALIVHPFKRR
jgi:DNA primase